jgi:4-aminobutyrate aminotransferase
VPPGLGKTGRFFVFEHVGAVPDAVVLGKRLGGGILPIAAVIADARLNTAPELALGHYTHEKSPLTTRAALTTIEIIERHDLIARAAELGRRVTAGIAEIHERVPLVVRARGRGLLLAIEFDPYSCGRQPGREFTDVLVSSLLAQGLSTTAKDAVSVGFSPPMTITPAEIDDALTRIERAALAPAAQGASGNSTMDRDGA